MDYAYSPLNPLVWLVFIGFCVATYLIVRLFHRRYPYYPDKPEDKEEAGAIARPQAREASSAGQLARAEAAEREAHPKAGRIRLERR